MKLGEFGRADASLEAVGNWMNDFAHMPWLMSITKR